MKIVIEIDELVYEGCLILNRANEASVVQKAIVNGKLLPEHHGRLIDADVLERKMSEYISTLPLTYDEAERIVLLMNHFDDAQTILEGSDSE